MVTPSIAGTISAEHNNYTSAPTTEKNVSLCEELKRLGFVRGKQVMLYGFKLELVSDPIVMGPDLVTVDAIEQNSRSPMRVRIPLTILNKARGIAK